MMGGLCSNGSTSSFLSPAIQNLYKSFENSTNDHGFPKYIENYKLNWSHIKTVLSEVHCTEGSEKWYKACLERLAPLFKEASLLDEEPVLKFLCEIYKDTCLCDDFDGFLEDPGTRLILLLMLTASLERKLREILLSHQKSVPFLLRDILASPDLQLFIPYEKIRVIQCLVGNVHGLNIRNLAWHGFYSPHEVRSPYVIIIVLIIKDLIDQHPAHVGDTNTKIQLLAPLSVCPQMKYCLMEQVERCGFIPDHLRPFWYTCTQLYQNRNPLAIYLIFPLMENCLRHMYAHVNDCRNRIGTATSSAFYTTFDEFLSPRDGNKPNRLPQYLGRQITESLHDLLSYPAGPRLRDRISHGEIGCPEIPSSLSDHIFRICQLILSLHSWRFGIPNYDILCPCHERSDQPKCQNVYCSVETPKYAEKSELPKFVEYKVIYHPYSFAKNVLMETLRDLKCMVTESNISADLKYHNLPHSIPNSFNSKILIDIIEEIELNILYEPKEALEIMGLIRNITENISFTINNMTKSYEKRSNLYENRSLRSRQRKLFEKHKLMIPEIHEIILLTLYVLAYIFRNINHIVYLGIFHLDKLRHTLKGLLKAFENSVSLTSDSCNNWEKALLIINPSIDLIKKEFVSA